MPSDLDWILKRDPHWRERPKKEALVIPRTHPTDARETRAARARRHKSANRRELA